MKKIFLFLLLSSFTIALKAVPLIGGSLTYQWLSDSTYRFSLKLYSSCDSPYAAMPTTGNLCFHNSCNNLTGTITMQQTPVPIPIPGTFGYKEYWYTADFTIPSKCNYWTFFTSVAGRNNSVNLLNGSADNIYIEATINNFDFPQQASPKFSIPPVPYLAVNQPAFFLTGLTDPDNDSIHMEVIQPRTAASSFNAVTCSATTSIIPYSTANFNILNNPLATNNSFVINPATNVMAFTPTMNSLGYNALPVVVKKYRNGILAGSIMRDLQVRVEQLQFDTASYQVPLNVSGIIFPTGSPSTTGYSQACAGTPIHFEMLGVPPASSPGSWVEITSNLTTVLPGSTFNVVNLGTTAKGVVDYTPAVTDTGLYTAIFVFKLHQPSSCLNPGTPVSSSYYLVFLKIDSCTLDVPAVNPSVNIKVFPNPANDFITIDAPFKINATLSTIDGRAVRKQNNCTSMDISELPAAVYFLKIEDETGVFLRTEKLVKQ
jgi:hypothetical protein